MSVGNEPERVVPQPRINSVSREQQAILVQFMEEHPEFFIGKMTHEYTIQKKKKLWRELVDLLNAEGPQKPLRKWMRTWSDWKFGVKKKLLSSAGPGPVPPMSYLERRLAKLLETLALAADIQSVPDVPPVEILIKEEFETEDDAPTDPEVFIMTSSTIAPDPGALMTSMNDSISVDDPEVFTMRKANNSPEDSKLPADPEVFMAPRLPTLKRAPEVVGERRSVPSKKLATGEGLLNFQRIATQQEITNERLDETNATLRDLNLAINNLSKTINSAASVLLNALGQLPPH